MQMHKFMHSWESQLSWTEVEEQNRRRETRKAKVDTSKHSIIALYHNIIAGVHAESQIGDIQYKHTNIVQEFIFLLNCDPNMLRICQLVTKYVVVLWVKVSS